MGVRGLTAVVGLCLSVNSVYAEPVGTAFTYQGELSSGDTPAGGAFDLRFRLYDSSSGSTQVGPTLCVDDVIVVNGRFAAILDFGDVFVSEARYLEIDVRAGAAFDCSSSVNFETLAVRQRLSAAPIAHFAIRAASAAIADNANALGGQAASFYRDASNLNSGTLAGGRLSGNYPNSITFSNAANAFSGIFTGNGAAITSLSAGAIASGSLADARLSSNVLLANTAQSVTSEKQFQIAQRFNATTASGPPFFVTSTSKVGNLNVDSLDGIDSTAFAQIALGQTYSGNNTFSGTSTFSGAATFSNSSSSFTGSGSGLTALNATNLASGSVPDARIPSTIPRLNAANTGRLGLGASPGSATILASDATQAFVQLVTTGGSSASTIGLQSNGTSTNYGSINFGDSSLPSRGTIYYNRNSNAFGLTAGTQQLTGLLPVV